jgi:hypothetical protein
LKKKKLKEQEEEEGGETPAPKNVNTRKPEYTLVGFHLFIFEGE